MFDKRPRNGAGERSGHARWATSRHDLRLNLRLLQLCFLHVALAAAILPAQAQDQPAQAQDQPAQSASATAQAGPSPDAAANSAAPSSAAPNSAAESTPGAMPDASDAAAEPATASDAEPFPDLTLPADATQAQLQALVEQAKQQRPRNPEQYQAMQTAIRDASKKLISLLDKQRDAPRIQQAELDSITSSVALMAFVGEDSQQKTLEQVHEFLKGRKELSMQDTQTGVLAAAMLELQPNKQPARETYQLLCDLLENDPREEMQSLCLNLKASIRRLDLLGNKFDLQATALDGREIRIDDYAGKFVIVDFFASWCQPCLIDAPHLKQQFAKYQDRGLAVIAISLDTDAQALNKYLEQAEFPWPVIHDNAEDPLQRLQMKFGVSHLPTVLLLNKEGTVVSLEARGAELDRLLEMLFETPTLAEPQATDSDSPVDEKPAPQTQSLIEPAK